MISTNPAQKNCIIILGMHRSGTSALAGVLNMLGIHSGDKLLPAMDGVNPKGFWEHAEIVSIHDKLLEALNSSWDDESPLPDEWWHLSSAVVFRDEIINVLRRDFGNQPIWLIKDPRICRLLPMWHEILNQLYSQPVFVLSLRNPAEVANSLRERDGLSEEASCLLWLTHMLEAELQTRSKPRIFVAYERLLLDWLGTVTHIGEILNLSWPVTTENALFEIEAFLDPSLRHHGDNITLPNHTACRLAQHGFELLSAPFPDDHELDRLRLQTEELAKLVMPWSIRLRQNERTNRKLNNRIIPLESENADLHADIIRIKNSISWQITKPLRLFQNLIKRNR